MFYFVRLYFFMDTKGKNRTEIIRVKAETPSSAICHVLSQDWSTAERKAIVCVMVNTESDEND